MGYEAIGVRRGWEGLTHLTVGPEEDELHPPPRSDQHANDRPDRRDRPSPRARTHARCAWPRCPPPSTVRGGRRWRSRRSLRRDARGPREPRGAGHRRPGHDRRRRHAVLLPVLANAGVPLVAIPKTMDNDVQGTEYCIGFSTAITRAKEAINRQRTTLGSHERIGVFRIFGRDAGFSALYTAYVTSARCVIPEIRYDLDALAAVVAQITMTTRATTPSSSAEEAIWKASLTDIGDMDAFGHRHKANVEKRWPRRSSGAPGSRRSPPSSPTTCAAASPTPVDSMVATTFANVAMDLVGDGVTGQMVAIQDGKYAHATRTRPSVRARSSTRCTTRSASGRATTGSSGTRCCWSGSTEQLALQGRELADRARADMSSSPWPWAISPDSRRRSMPRAAGSRRAGPPARARCRGPCDGAPA